MTKIINGKIISFKKEKVLKAKVEKWVRENKRRPVLISLVANEDELGLLYTRLKQKAAERLNVCFRRELFSLRAREKALRLMEAVVEKDDFEGLMVQKPGQELMGQYFKSKKEFKSWWLKMIGKIPVNKDVDGLNPQTLGRIVVGEGLYYPATVKACYLALLEVFKESELEGKRAVIAGSSEILGKPLAMLLRDKGMTVVMFGSSEKNISQLSQEAEVVIACVGRPKLIKAEMVRKGAVVIDAGMRIVQGRPVGDVDFDKVVKKAKAITPVPGGIGPMTVISLLDNLVEGLEVE
jgi:methylenetetrahydrofolate dehydrogenase (NADP+)/methenyltetrahydrofolate cyclohydrolase